MKEDSNGKKKSSSWKPKANGRRMRGECAEGKALARNARKRKVSVMCDAREIVQWINNGPIPKEPCGRIIQHCKELIVQDWDMYVDHISRDLNCAVDRVKIALWTST
nr:factor of DNA methylation 4-like [Ipomoea trifida]